MKPSQLATLFGIMFLAVSGVLEHYEKKAERSETWDKALAEETQKATANGVHGRD
jgi:hypothetical protein